MEWTRRTLQFFRLYSSRSHSRIRLRAVQQSLHTQKIQSLQSLSIVMGEQRGLLFQCFTRRIADRVKLGILDSEERLYLFSDAFYTTAS